MIALLCIFLVFVLFFTSSNQQKNHYVKIKVELEKIAYTKSISGTFVEIHDLLRNFYDLMSKANITDHELQEMLGIMIHVDEHFESIVMDSHEPNSSNVRLIRKVNERIQDLLYDDVSKVYRYKPLMPHGFADKINSFASYH